MKYNARPEYCFPNRSYVRDDGELLLTSQDGCRELGRRFGNVRSLSFSDKRTVLVHSDSGSSTINVIADSNEVIQKLNVSGFSKVLVDLTLMPVEIWAPVIKHLLRHHIQVRAMYSEPKSYSLWQGGFASTGYDNLRMTADTNVEADVLSSQSLNRSVSLATQAASASYGNGMVAADGAELEFHISQSTRGNRPIPTFASLLRFDQRRTLPLVVLLGFEGWRVAQLLQDLEFDPEPLYPVVGCPGYKIDYPGFSVSANTFCLSNPRWSTHLRLASACSPFAVFEVLAELSRDMEQICIAPLGTTPMLLGAILFACVDERASVVYDHPIRAHGGLSERGRTWVYDLSNFGAFK